MNFVWILIFGFLIILLKFALPLFCLFSLQGSPRRLNIRNVKTLTNQKCRAIVVENQKNLIESVNICTLGNLKRDEDEGTALIDAKSRTLIGLSSLIFVGNDGTYTDVYLTVQPAIQWIKQTIRENKI